MAKTGVTEIPLIFRIERSSEGNLLPGHINYEVSRLSEAIKDDPKRSLTWTGEQTFVPEPDRFYVKGLEVIDREEDVVVARFAWGYGRESEELARILNSNG